MLVVSTLSLVTTKVVDVRASRNQVVPRNGAESGIHQGIANVKLARDLAIMASAFGGVDAMDPKVPTGPGSYTQGYNGQPLQDPAGNRIAEFDVFYDVLIYSARNRIMNHDERIAGDGGSVFGFSIPDTWKALELTNRETEKELPAATLGNPAYIATYYKG